MSSHRHISDEYLILNQIPEEAIVDMSTIKDMTSESCKSCCLVPETSKHFSHIVPVQNEDEEEPQEGEELELNNYLRYSSTSALEMSLCI